MGRGPGGPARRGRGARTRIRSRAGGARRGRARRPRRGSPARRRARPWRRRRDRHAAAAPRRRGRESRPRRGRARVAGPRDRRADARASPPRGSRSRRPPGSPGLPARRRRFVRAGRLRGRIGRLRGSRDPPRLDGSRSRRGRVSGTSRQQSGRVTTPSLIIFDCDGVLVDSEAISNGMLAQMLAEQGLELTLAESRARFQGHLLAEIVGISEALLGRPLPEGWIEEYVERRAAVFDAKLRPVAGAAELVERVRSSGVPSCVASQGSLAKTARSLALTGLAGYFAEDVRFSA